MDKLQNEQQRRNQDSNHPEQLGHRMGGQPALSRHGQSLRPGAIGGIVVGGAILLAILAVMYVRRSSDDAV